MVQVHSIAVKKKFFVETFSIRDQDILSAHLLSLKKVTLSYQMKKNMKTLLRYKWNNSKTGKYKMAHRVLYWEKYAKKEEKEERKGK